jgi:hypothetical protein
MKIVAKNTTILNSSLQFNDEKTEITYHANRELYVEGNPYADLFTPKTVFDLKCPTNEVNNIQAITELQVNTWVSENYPIA